MSKPPRHNRLADNFPETTVPQPEAKKPYDYTIIGGGIVGISTALQIRQRQPDSSVLLVEKEADLAQHQTGHNSGVIHAGVYYQPGSLKADFCKQGAIATLAYCRQHAIPVEQPGKLLVATSEIELQRLSSLEQRCQRNGITARRLNRTELLQLEPNISGKGALLVDQSAIVNFGSVASAMARQLLHSGASIATNTELLAATEDRELIHLETSQGKISSRYVVACSGLMADRVARMMNIEINFAIIPFRGEYYQLPATRQALVKHLIYPVPDPALPFLGVHLTPMIDGSITVGPNAVLGWKREGYGRFNLGLKDSIEMAAFPGFWRLARQHARSGLKEMKNSLYKNGYLQQVQRYCPQLLRRDLLPYPPGIRAQAVLRNGSLVEDFLFAETRRSLHVCNAPSPAATSAIPIGAYIASRLIDKIA